MIEAMRQFSAFVKKEFLHILRDRRTLLILLGMPIAQILLFGFAITTEVKNTQVAVFDPTPSVETRRITERIDASSYFSVTRRLTSPEQINDIFKYGRIGLVVVFSDNFAGDPAHCRRHRPQSGDDADKLCKRHLMLEVL